MTLCFFTLVRAFYRHHLDRRLITVIYLLYFLVYSLFFKYPGIKGVNPDLCSFLQGSLFIDTIVPRLNIFIFIPLGALFCFRLKHIALFILVILLVESAQYFPYLGVFDIEDVVTDTIGFLIGNGIHNSFIGHYIRRSIK